jgi:hypothetical protein
MAWGRGGLIACPVSVTGGYRTFRAKSGALILKIHIDQELAQSLIARELPNGRALRQAGLRAATARFCTESTTTPSTGIRNLTAQKQVTDALEADRLVVGLGLIVFGHFVLVAPVIPCL